MDLDDQPTAAPQWNAVRSVAADGIRYRIAAVPMVCGRGRTDAAARADLLRRLAEWPTRWPPVRAGLDAAADAVTETIRTHGAHGAVADLVAFPDPPA